jgi:hypothetical protein
MRFLYSPSKRGINVSSARKFRLTLARPSLTQLHSLKVLERPMLDSFFVLQSEPVHQPVQFQTQRGIVGIVYRRESLTFIFFLMSGKYYTLATHLISIIISGAARRSICTIVLATTAAPEKISLRHFTAAA